MIVFLYQQEVTTLLAKEMEWERNCLISPTHAVLCERDYWIFSLCRILMKLCLAGKSSPLSIKFNNSTTHVIRCTACNLSLAKAREPCWSLPESWKYSFVLCIFLQSACSGICIYCSEGVYSEVEKNSNLSQHAVCYPNRILPWWKGIQLTSL